MHGSQTHTERSVAGSQKINIELLDDPETPLLHSYSKEVKQVCTKKSTFSTCRKVFTEALFIRTKK